MQPQTLDATAAMTPTKPLDIATMEHLANEYRLLGYTAGTYNERCICKLMAATLERRIGEEQRRQMEVHLES